MNLDTASVVKHPDLRPWFREPWVWLLIALPSIAVIGCAITIWLALSRPDHLVLDKQQQQTLEAGLRARELDQAKDAAGQDDGDR